MGAIYTIGYGNRNAEVFVELLRRYQIGYLIDIRSQPYSKSSPTSPRSAALRFC